MQGAIDFEPQHSYVESDSDSALSSMRDRVLDVVAKRSLVHAIPSVPVDTRSESPVRSTATPPSTVDRDARSVYMQGWRARSKQLRLENRARAKLAPRRSPRLASKARYADSF